TILTAAHCVEGQSTGNVILQGQPVPLTCERHPNYPSDRGADFALCLASLDIPIPDGGFETVEIASQRPAQNEAETLLGYGCRTVGGQDHNFGSLFYGEARVTEIRDKYGFIQARGGAALCSGDSGGGAYFLLNPSGSRRRLFAVNAQGDLSQNSWLAP